MINTMDSPYSSMGIYYSDRWPYDQDDHLQDDSYDSEKLSFHIHKS